MKAQMRLAALLAVVLTFLTSPLYAQSTLAVADAAAFMGTWTLDLQSPQGPFEQELVLKDADGKVAGEISNQMMPGVIAVNDIAIAGGELILKFMGDFQGTPFNAKITLTPEAPGKAKVVFDVMDGQFVMEGSGVKK